MRYIIEISYVGSGFHGWQIQPNAITIQEEIEKALSLVLGEKTPINGSSRTDVGVHAKQQYAHFETKHTKLDIYKTINRLNKLLPKAIAIHNLYKVYSGQHTRFDALNRKYIYRISKTKDPFTAINSAFYPYEYDIKSMNDAAKTLLNHQNFKSFCKVKTEVKTYLCAIQEAFWIQNEGILEFHIRANRFLRGMVRAIVGTLLDVGKGKLTLIDFEKIIIAQDRTKAGVAAKTNGLTLQEVTYPEDYFNNSFQIAVATQEDLPIIKDLFIEYQKYLGISLCFQGFTEELESLPSPYNEPNGGILVLKVQNEIVGMVAMKQLEADICEMKRLYIKTDYQGFGFGIKMVEAIIELAKSKNFKLMKLDTLERLTSAIFLYRKFDFIETLPYNYNPENDILYFEKVL